MTENRLKSVLRKFGIDIKRAELHKNDYIKRSAWDYQSAFVLPHHKDADVVVDIGCGHAPSPISSILTEFFPDESVHRARPVVEDRPLVVCSAERMPFRDDAFDLSICTHVLEHLTDPAKAANEIARISAKGYLETPSYGKDTLIGTGRQHLWQVVNSDQTLHFFPYTQRQHEANFDSPFMTIWCQDEYHPLQPFFWERQDVFNSIQFWSDRPKIEVHGKVETSATKEWTPVAEDRLPTWEPALNAGEISALEARLVTPDRSSPMRYLDGEFVDASARIRYPVRGKRVYFEIG